MSKGNTEGSKVWLSSAEDFYILGLWLADGYWWSSSFGLSSSDSRLIKRFSKFLKRIAPDSFLKRRVYKADGSQKRKKKAEHIYINNREITRQFLSYKKRKKLFIPKIYLPAYLAGRIDGDGSIDRKHRSGIRIVYGKKLEARRDVLIFGERNVSLYYYKTAKTWVIYLRKHFRDKIIPKARKYSFKLLPRRDSPVRPEDSNHSL